jgi:hypothetical protein
MSVRVNLGGGNYAIMEPEVYEVDRSFLEDGNEDGSNRDVPPFDNDPRTDEQIKQAVYDAYDRGEWD